MPGPGSGMENIHNLTWILFTETEHIRSIGGRAVRISSSYMSLGGPTNITVGSGNIGHYFSYSSENRDRLTSEWTWFLLFGFIALIVAITIGVVAFQHCCVDGTEYDDAAFSGDEAEDEEYVEGKKKEDKQPIARIEVEMNEMV